MIETVLCGSKRLLPLALLTLSCVSNHGPNARSHPSHDDSRTSHSLYFLLFAFRALSAGCCSGLWPRYLFVHPTGTWLSTSDTTKTSCTHASPCARDHNRHIHLPQRPQIHGSLQFLIYPFQATLWRQDLGYLPTYMGHYAQAPARQAFPVSLEHILLNYTGLPDRRAHMDALAEALDLSFTYHNGRDPFHNDQDRKMIEDIANFIFWERKQVEYDHPRDTESDFKIMYEFKWYDSRLLCFESSLMARARSEDAKRESTAILRPDDLQGSDLWVLQDSDVRKVRTLCMPMSIPPWNCL